MRSVLCFTVVFSFLGACKGSSPNASSAIPWIDTHAHATGVSNNCTSSTCVNAAIATMDTYGLRKSIWMSPPSTNATGDESLIRATVNLRPDRLFYGAGGTDLNSLIQQTDDDGGIPDGGSELLTSRLRALVDGGGVVAFGEIAVLHLSYEPAHPFEETQANTALFFKLVDEAAANDIAIDLHDDVVSTSLATPAFFVDASVNNPSQLSPNLAGVETLLAYNRNARIVLAHVGRDTTTHMTPTLMRSLLAAHSNLYAQIAPAYGPLKSATAIVDQQGTIRTDWLTLLQDYPTRFVLGTDSFYKGTSSDATLLNQVQHFLGQLSADLATKIGCTNPVTIYKLPSGC